MECINKLQLSLLPEPFRSMRLSFPAPSAFHSTSALSNEWLWLDSSLPHNLKCSEKWKHTARKCSTRCTDLCNLRQWIKHYKTPLSVVHPSAQRIYNATVLVSASYIHTCWNRMNERSTHPAWWVWTTKPQLVSHARVFCSIIWKPEILSQTCYSVQMFYSDQ